MRAALVAWTLLFSSLSLAGEATCDAELPAMRCLKARSAVIGEGRARRAVAVERFFLDTQEVSAAAYARCVDAGACAPLLGPTPAPDVAVRVDWARAERYCAFAGKRLPSEAEWEVAALEDGRGTLPVWTKTWLVDPRLCKAPAVRLEEASEGAWAEALCGSRDVLDACDGAALCGNLYRRVVKDPKAPKRRRGENAWPDKRAHAVRCASSHPWLTSFPPRALREPLPEVPALEPPSAAELAAFLSVTEDRLDVPPCEEPGRSFADCRDPRSYLKTNEPLLGVVLPYVKNRGGGYVGVGSDQSYTLVAAARSRWVWLFDYDENVVRWHFALRALILAAPDRASLVAFFEGDGVARGAEVIRASYRGTDEEDAVARLFRGAAPPLASHYRRLARDEAYRYSWLGNDNSYRYIRALYQQGRMRAFRGNMLDTNAMRTIGDAARRLSVVVRIYYPSNAPEFWAFTDAYRANVRGLPLDDDSVVVQTISGVSMKTGFGQRGYWHYNVQGGLAHQRLLSLPGFTRHRQLLFHRVKTDSGELTVTDLR